MNPQLGSWRIEIVPGDGRGLVALGQLPLQHHQIADFKGGLADHQIKLPHAAEPFALAVNELLAVVLEALVPGF